MLKSVKGLYDLGFAIHLLRPKSKVPLNSGWTKGPRATWEEIEKQYKPGMNVGVRLGEASKVGNGYLAVIDVDVKSTDPRHRKEAYAFLEHSSKPNNGPKVLTGRGNGSAHIYGRTREPAITQRVGQSKDVVKVSIPSSEKPSKRELAELSNEEIKKGIRLRPAWEIQIMGEGSQVVLPPSIHPDTGKKYEWANGPLDSSKPFQLPLFNATNRALEQNGKNKKDNEEKTKFTPEEVDLVSSTLPDKIVGQIMSGEEVDDRSAALFSACLSMIKAKFTDNQIMSVLTDKTYFLGSVAYDHRKTNSRAHAADWILNHNIIKARKSIEAKYQFDAEVEVASLNDEEEELQAIELLEPDDWRVNIEQTGPNGDERPKQTVKNIVYILRGELGDALFTKNDFSGLQHYTRETPWGARAGDEINDEHIIRIQHWLSQKYRFEPSLDKINSAVTVIAAENSFHPVRDYLEKIEWDGTVRIDDWLRRYAGATALEPYLSAISRKTLVAMIARIYQPGCKFDTVLILEGPQGIGKSTMVRILAGEWFSDAHINVSDKDGVLSMRGTWIVELGELSGMRRADAEAFKEFTSRGFDRIRVPYGRRTENFPRQCIFIGTTNSDEYLKDVTGNRRFWPVKVGDYDLEAFKRDRDQLLAEAKWVYDNLDEPLWLNKEENTAAISEQKDRMIQDAWSDKINDFLIREAAKPQKEFPIDAFLMKHLFDGMGPLAAYKDGMVEQKRAADALKALGYTKAALRLHDNVLRRYWVKK